MLAAFNQMGGKHRKVERTADRAEIELTIGDEELTESLSWEEAQQEPFPFEKDGKTPKKNWRTPRARRQMLWARVVSEGVRTLRPAIVAGTYTPEEAVDFGSGDNPNGHASGQPVDVEELMRQQQEKEGEGEPIDILNRQFGNLDVCSIEQQDEINALLRCLDASGETISKILANRGVQAFTQLASDQADELIEALKERATGPSRQPADAMQSDVTGPASQTLVDEIKSLMRGDPETVKLVKAHLTKHGKTKLAELSIQDAELLRNCLQSKQLESFFSRALSSPEGDQDAPFDAS